MRIIGGVHGGRVIQPPMKSWPTRPTTDIAKEALYNILMNRIDFEDITMLDLFGGAGTHTFEFKSRGALFVVYVDSYGKCGAWVRREMKSLFPDGGYDIRTMDVRKYINKTEKQFDFIFADPPYALPWLNKLPGMIFEAELLDQAGTLVIEHGHDQSFENEPFFTESRKYGQSRFSFFNRG